MTGTTDIRPVRSGTAGGQHSDAGLTAEATARRVLAWAATSCWSATPAGPPSGQLRRSVALAAPAEPTMTALCELARSTGARLGAGAPPFGDRSPLGLGALLLAAAIGGRAQPAEAGLLAEATAPPRLGAAQTGWADAVARHGVVAPFMAQVRTPEPAPPPASVADPAAEPLEPLAEVLLRASPLTAVLHRPTASRLADSGTTGVEIAAVMALLGRPRGAAVLERALSRWSPDALVLGWRTQLFGMLVTTGSHPEFVADTYLTARLEHGPAWDSALGNARWAMRGRDAKPDRGSIATVRYWLPLANLHRDTDLVRNRPRLLREARIALDLVKAHRKSLIPVVVA